MKINRSQAHDVKILFVKVSDSTNTFKAYAANIFCLESLFGLRFYVPVNSYGHAGTVSSANHFHLGI